MRKKKYPRQDGTLKSKEDLIPEKDRHLKKRVSRVSVSGWASSGAPFSPDAPQVGSGAEVKVPPSKTMLQKNSTRDLRQAAIRQPGLHCKKPSIKKIVEPFPSKSVQRGGATTQV